MQRTERATEESVQSLLNEVVRVRQGLQQIIGLHESLLQVTLQNNAILRRLAGINSIDMPLIRPH